MNIQFSKKSHKQIQIDKAQSTMMLVVGIATILTVFSLIGAKALLNEATYQRRVINARHQAEKQINDDLKNSSTLISQYNDVFEGNGSTNAIGGRNTTDPSAVPPDGDNGRLVLDALPTAYDYPALLNSVSKILNSNNIGTPTIGGTDQSSTVDNAPLPNPQPINIDLTIGGTATYANIQSLIKDLERSIRPFNITKLSVSGNESSMTFSISVSTYYQVAKTLDINSKEIR